VLYLLSDREQVGAAAELDANTKIVSSYRQLAPCQSCTKLQRLHSTIDEKQSTCHACSKENHKEWKLRATAMIVRTCAAGRSADEPSP
jgi:hypothetical protein